MLGVVYVRLEVVTAEHGVHVAAPRALKKPGAHPLHATCGFGEKVPAAHGASRMLPVPMHVEPVAHGVGAAPCVAQWLPAGHGFPVAPIEPTAVQKPTAHAPEHAGDARLVAPGAPK